MPIAEIDDYPTQARSCACEAGRPPPGNAIFTLGVDRLDGRGLSFITPPAVRNCSGYDNRSVATVIGAGELLELVD